MENGILDSGMMAQSESGQQRVEFAGFWIRTGAALIDFFVLLPLVLLSIYNSLNIKSLPFMIVIALLSAVYKPIMEWKKSATFGKMAVGIKVVDKQKNNITGEQAVKRYFPWIISSFISLGMSVFMFLDPDFQNVDEYLQLSAFNQNSPFNYINMIYGILFLIILIFVGIDSRKQGLHDKFAETFVIKNKVFGD